MSEQGNLFAPVAICAGALVRTTDGRDGAVVEVFASPASGKPGDKAGPRKQRVRVRFASKPGSREARDYGSHYDQHHDVAALGVSA